MSHTSALPRFILITFASITLLSCNNNGSVGSKTGKKSDVDNADHDLIFRQVTALDEFKREDKRIDAINKTSKVPVELTIQIIDSSYLDEDQGKSVALAFVTERYPFVDNIIYVIKFDKARKEIISIRKNRPDSASPGSGTPQDLPLPAKK